ncbi:hypothetical protein AMJ82_08880 [candidate division TA06 bacterium SM23_40]|uniref:Uncharacterized protein n=1 Tax=candidate division TA06 bacterium SM23_40 TaxID=1703774 RepID=A0A0S8G5I7_UNCT6|nr:MAG: hypothetical protein AMJ82_08880 [candidate division TA06 bacterium SM23_40]
MATQTEELATTTARALYRRMRAREGARKTDHEQAIRKSRLTSNLLPAALGREVESAKVPRKERAICDTTD